MRINWLRHEKVNDKEVLRLEIDASPEEENNLLEFIIKGPKKPVIGSLEEINTSVPLKKPRQQWSPAARAAAAERMRARQALKKEKDPKETLEEKRERIKKKYDKSTIVDTDRDEVYMREQRMNTAVPLKKVWNMQRGAWDDE